MTYPGTILLTRADVAALLRLGACIDAVEMALRLEAEGAAPPPRVLGIPAEGGGFHVKAALLVLGRPYFAAKVNANFPQNAERGGLPTIQGTVALMDGADGSPLAVMDSAEITARRTAAVTAAAAKVLARGDASVVTLCGCGVQGAMHLRALALVRPIERAFVFDLDGARARRLGEALSVELRLEVVPVEDPGPAARRSDVCITCTPSRRAYLGPADVAAGAFVAAVGADSPEKQEIDPTLFAAARVVVDDLEQCAASGDLHHALDAGAVRREDVHGTLGQILAGRRPGRTSDREITLFDSTGTALADVAAAALVYEAAVREGRGIRAALGT